MRAMTIPIVLWALVACEQAPERPPVLRENRFAALGSDPACNSTTDVLNDSICVLGSPVATKDPGPASYTSSGDGTTPSSGSAVDIDVLRIPDRYLRAAPATTSLAVQTVADASLAIGMLAVSVDTAAVSP